MASWNEPPWKPRDVPRVRLVCLSAFLLAVSAFGIAGLLWPR